MQAVEITDTVWERLLALCSGSGETPAGDDPATALYAPIAGARGPFVLAQVGQSLDGRVATPSGDAANVSGPDGLAHLHRCRALVDAVVVGVSTVKADNPRLSVRLAQGPSPVRVVIDCHGALDGREGLFHDGGAPVIVIESTSAPARPLPNAEILRMPPSGTGLATGAIVNALAGRGLNRLLVEGGARTIARFIEEGQVDRLHVAISPLIIGTGPSGITLPPVARLSDALRPPAEVFSLGSDILFDCVLTTSGRQGKKVDVADGT
ncbi:RibD family protein [uncultured Martelella sp.]|uniref:RibD family protein n=1 Tax=uncultured Martelella sp. TaxID=392331 RepID=UPI0029C63C58|nr:RibD family protein [uncultured Martelella sp.]